MTVPCCGPKLSLCCLLLSIWGVIMLALLGVFFQIKSPALAEDLPFNEDHWAEANYSFEYVEDLYNKASWNCFIAAALYAGTLVASFILWKINERSNYTMS